MTTQAKSIIALVLAIVIGGAIYGAYQYPIAQYAVSSPAGTSFSTAKVAGQQLTLATTTFYSQLNTDASDRTILGFEAMIRGATGTSTTYSVLCATSTNASSLGNTNYIVQTTLATSTFGTLVGDGTYVATTSPGLTGTSTASTLQATLTNSYIRNWKAGSYLNCQVTTVDLGNAFNSGTNGTWNFPYRSQ